MKIPVLLTSLALFLPPLIAAVPSPEELKDCRTVRRIDNLQEGLSLPRDQVAWGCIDASALSKSDLMTLADNVSGFRVRMSVSPLNKNDLAEISKKAFMTVDVDTPKVGRTDVIDMQKAGVNVVMQTSSLTFNSVDYREIAKAGPATLEIDSPGLTKEELLEIVREPDLKVLIDGPASGLSPQDIQDLLKAASNVRLRL